MSDLNLHIDLNPPQQSYAPGSTIRGTVTITAPNGPTEIKSAELLLFWRTSGIGTRDEGMPTTIELVTEGTTLPSHFTKDFEITAPIHPWTYNGNLIKIGWILGVYVKTGWMKNQELEVPIEIRPASQSTGSASGPTEFFYDKHGHLVNPPPLNI